MESLVAMKGYNDDLVMSFSIGLWVRDNALRLRQEGIDLTKKGGIGTQTHGYMVVILYRMVWKQTRGNKKLVILMRI